MTKQFTTHMRSDAHRSERNDAAPRLFVIEVTANRPDRPDYHAKVQVLNGRVVDDGFSAGWHVTRIAAADTTPAQLLHATRDADAIVILGGEDITPSFYGAAAGYEGETRHFSAADEGQIALVRRALEENTPLLGICRGLQIINVALGGTIVQHIEDGIHKNVNVPVDQILSTHGVTLTAASGLARGLGDTQILVQSAHHQSVGELGAGLVPVAVAPDGLIEALEHESAPITGVQWHPEAPDSPVEQLPLLLASLRSRIAVVLPNRELVAA
ncbi:gamma-glutamyl-gamma-aminobutyrate hydrolase family protein [Cryobacterium sp. CG_9.6]|uniref:gamma-glutamyl-gamma-aminobutyrate hydrolase family protein n=1 Tax=Cryobacterium sp. CG_9.6 TaxID=2760710 RepID=UPI002476A086|nr:gamma-glutamyl-gamma-aminobutyrate hydrolase family protein [Cryobacterium sp. CG_9.6]MDH6237585.1 putative glutamine amidotransferase [Cryobacterium sp. CG_9.6]